MIEWLNPRLPGAIPAGNLILGAAFIGLLTGRWLPRGVAAGWLVIAVFFLLLWIDPGQWVWPNRPPTWAECSVWAAIFGLGLLVTTVLRRRARAVTANQGLSAAEQSLVFGHCATWVGVGAAASLLSQWNLELPPAAISLPTAAALAALGIASQRREDRVITSSIAGLLLLVSMILSAPGLSPGSAASGAAASAVLTSTAMFCVLVSVLSNWNRRRRGWDKDPLSLLRPEPTDPLAHGMALMLSLGAIVLMLLTPTNPWLPLLSFIAALASGAVAHRRSWPIADDCTVLQIGATAFLAGTCWWPTGWAGAAFGATLAPLLLIWLARFWRQQLLSGQPWTTTGRLVAPARRLAQTGTVAGAVAMAGWIFASAGAPAPVSLVVCALLAQLLLIRLLCVDARERQDPHGALAAGMAGAVAAALAWAGFQSLGWNVDPVLPLGAIALLLSLRLTRVMERPAYASACNLYLGGIFPVVILPRITQIPTSTTESVTAWVGLVLVGLAAMLRWSRSRPRSVLNAGVALG